jgi:hypothetical protein
MPSPNKDSLTIKEKTRVIVTEKKADTTVAIKDVFLQTPVIKTSKYISLNKKSTTSPSSKKSVSFRSLE